MRHPFSSTPLILHYFFCCSRVQWIISADRSCTCHQQMGNLRNSGIGSRRFAIGQGLPFKGDLRGLSGAFQPSSRSQLSARSSSAHVSIDSKGTMERGTYRGWLCSCSGTAFLDYLISPLFHWTLIYTRNDLRYATRIVLRRRSMWRSRSNLFV